MYITWHEALHCPAVVNRFGVGEKVALKANTIRPPVTV